MRTTFKYDKHVFSQIPPQKRCWALLLLSLSSTSEESEESSSNSWMQVGPDKGRNCNIPLDKNVFSQINVRKKWKPAEHDCTFPPTVRSQKSPLATVGLRQGQTRGETANIWW